MESAGLAVNEHVGDADDGSLPPIDRDSPEVGRGASSAYHNGAIQRRLGSSNDEEVPAKRVCRRESISGGTAIIGPNRTVRAESPYPSDDPGKTTVYGPLKNATDTTAGYDSRRYPGHEIVFNKAFTKSAAAQSAKDYYRCVECRRIWDKYKRVEGRYDFTMKMRHAFVREGTFIHRDPDNCGVTLQYNSGPANTTHVCKDMNLMAKITADYERLFPAVQLHGKHSKQLGKMKSANADKRDHADRGPFNKMSKAAAPKDLSNADNPSTSTAASSVAGTSSTAEPPVAHVVTPDGSHCDLPPVRDGSDMSDYSVCSDVLQMDLGSMFDTPVDGARLLEACEAIPSEDTASSESSTPPVVTDIPQLPPAEPLHEATNNGVVKSESAHDDATSNVQDFSGRNATDARVQDRALESPPSDDCAENGAVHGNGNTTKSSSPAEKVQQVAEDDVEIKVVREGAFETNNFVLKLLSDGFYIKIRNTLKMSNDDRANLKSILGQTKEDPRISGTEDCEIKSCVGGGYAITIKNTSTLPQRYIGVISQFAKLDQ